MFPFIAWLTRVLEMGESVQDAPPAFAAAEQAEALPVLRSAFDRHALEVAGPPLAFDPPTAVWAAGQLAAACWTLASGADGPIDRREPATAGQHLSADTLLRFLPAVYRRAKARAADGELARSLDAIFRAWPLTGALADLGGSPTTPPTFDGHAGLQLLYAERLVERPRAGWLPPPGPGLDWADRVFAERDRPLPAPPLGDL